MNRAPTVFCCYASVDRNLVEEVRFALEERGIETWIDKERLDVGDEFLSEITRALKEADFVLFFISKAAVKSKWVAYEVKQAMNEQIELNQNRILPLRLDSTKPPQIVAILQWVNLWGRYFDDGIESIVRAIDRHSVARRKEGEAISRGDMSPGKAERRNQNIAHFIQKCETLVTWLPKDRQTEILRNIENILRSHSLHLHRLNHLKQVKFRMKGEGYNPEDPAWVSIAPTSRIHDTSHGTRLIIGFSNKGCEYRGKDPLHLGCFFCGFYAGLVPPDRDKIDAALLTQFIRALQKTSGWREYDVIEFLSDGSFLNDREVPERAKRRIFKLLGAMPHVTRVLVESTPEFVYSQRQEIYERVTSLAPHQQFEIGIGLETADDFIRNCCVNKGTIRRNFEKAVRHIGELPDSLRNRCGVIAYLFLGPPFLTEREAVQDVVESIKYITDLSQNLGVRIVPKIEPAVVANGTLLSLLLKRGKEFGCELYSPPSYWAVLEVISRITLNMSSSSMFPEIRIGGRDDMHEAIRLPGVYEGRRFDQIDFLLYAALQDFNRHQDLTRVFSYIMAVLGVRGERLRGYHSSFSKWKRSWEGSASDQICAVSKYVEHNEKLIRAEASRMADSSEVYFASCLYQALDYIEGHEPLPHESAMAYLEHAKKWARVYRGSTDPREAFNKLKAPISERIRNALVVSGLRATVPEVEELIVEKHPASLVRIGFRANDLLTRKSFRVWAGIPLTAT